MLYFVNNVIISVIEIYSLITNSILKRPNSKIQLIENQITSYKYYHNINIFLNTA